MKIPFEAERQNEEVLGLPIQTRLSLEPLVVMRTQRATARIYFVTTVEA